MRQEKKFRFFIPILVIVAVPLVFLAYYQYNNRLFLFEAEILWGSKQFNETEFKNGSPETRASMTADLIRSKKFIGERCDYVPEILGERTGDYYHSDGNFTYKLSERQSANWILTFICGDSSSIEKVFIRKSCCSTSQKLLHWGLEAIEPLIKP
jgi:hypothetical protein